MIFKMGMSTNVTGFRSRDGEEFKKHYKVLQACIEAGVTELPKETADFFGDDTVEEYIVDDFLECSINDCLTEYSGDMEDGYEIDVKKIPKGVEKIRFYNSY